MVTLIANNVILITRLMYFIKIQALSCIFFMMNYVTWLVILWYLQHMDYLWWCISKRSVKKVFIIVTFWRDIQSYKMKLINFHTKHGKTCLWLLWSMVMDLVVAITIQFVNHKITCMHMPLLDPKSFIMGIHYGHICSSAPRTTYLLSTQCHAARRCVLLNQHTWQAHRIKYDVRTKKKKKRMLMWGCVWISLRGRWEFIDNLVGSKLRGALGLEAENHRVPHNSWSVLLNHICGSFMHALCGSKSLSENEEELSIKIRISHSHTSDFVFCLIWSKYVVTVYFANEQKGPIYYLCYGINCSHLLTMCHEVHSLHSELLISLM